MRQDSASGDDRPDFDCQVRSPSTPPGQEPAKYEFDDFWAFPHRFFTASAPMRRPATRPAPTRCKSAAIPRKKGQKSYADKIARARTAWGASRGGRPQPK